MLAGGSSGTIRAAVATPNSQPPKGSRLFEQLNLERLNKSSQIVSHAESAIAQAKRLIEHTRELVRQASDLREH